MEHFLNSPEFLLGLASTVFAVLAWALKLENQSKINKAEIDSLKIEVRELLAKHEALDSNIIKELARIREALVRLETTLSFYESKKKSPKV